MYKKEERESAESDWKVDTPEWKRIKIENH